MNEDFVVRCPECGWIPEATDSWECAPPCDAQWNTFATGGRCPKCFRQWSDTQCLSCGAWSSHSAWKVPVEGNRIESLGAALGASSADHAGFGAGTDVPGGVTRKSRGVGVKVLVALLLVATVAGLLVYRSDRVGYWWASYRDTPEAYEAFLVRFRSSPRAPMAKLRRDLGLEEQLWERARSEDSVSGYRSYIERYQFVPADMRHRIRVDEAQERLSERIESLWANGKPWASVDEIERFLREYPEKDRSGEVATTIQTLRDEARARGIARADGDAWTSAVRSNEYDSYARYLKRFPQGIHHREAEQAIERFESDWEWVKARDELEVYQRFLARFPGHEEKDSIERRILELEVESIMAGNPGELTPADAIVLGGDEVRIAVENRTIHVLTVRYLGPSLVRVTIAPHQSREVVLEPGLYTETASVPPSSIRDYAGVHFYEAGLYAHSFYVQESQVPDPRAVSDPWRSPPRRPIGLPRRAGLRCGTGGGFGIRRPSHRVTETRHPCAPIATHPSSLGGVPPAVGQATAAASRRRRWIWTTGRSSSNPGTPCRSSPSSSHYLVAMAVSPWIERLRGRRRARVRPGPSGVNGGPCQKPVRSIDVQIVPMESAHDRSSVG